MSIVVPMIIICESSSLNSLRSSIETLYFLAIPPNVSPFET
jgi:hypothetical protein